MTSPDTFSRHGFPNNLTRGESRLAAKKKTGFQLERSLQELEKLVETMEKGDISLEESLAHFEKGVQLTKACQKALQEAEQTVNLLLEKNGQTAVQKFDSDE